MFKKDPSLRSHEVVDGMDKGGPRAHLRNVGLLKEELKLNQSEASDGCGTCQ